MSQQYPAPQNIPIVGERKVKLACRNGHYEETAHPFQMIIPGGPGTQATDFLAVRLCRMCWMDFIATHCGMRELSDEEARQLLAARLAEAQAAEAAASEVRS